MQPEKEMTTCLCNLSLTRVTQTRHPYIYKAGRFFKEIQARDLIGSGAALKGLNEHPKMANWVSVQKRTSCYSGSPEDITKHVYPKG